MDEEMNTRDKGKSLEQYIANKLLEIFPDEFIRPTKNSGASTELEDLHCKEFIVQCKVDNTKNNIIIKYKDWKKLLSKIPMGSTRIPFFVNQNKDNDKFITLEADDFFKLLKEKNC